MDHRLRPVEQKRALVSVQKALEVGHHTKKDELFAEDAPDVLFGYKICIIKELSQAEETIRDARIIVDNAHVLDVTFTDKEGIERRYYVSPFSSKQFDGHDNQREVGQCRKKIEEGSPFVVRLTKSWHPSIEIQVLGK